MAADRAVLAVYRDTGKVAHMLVGAGQLIEQRRFAAVLVAGQGKTQRLSFGDLTARLAVVVAGGLTQFAHAGVGHRRVPCLAAGSAVRFVDIVHFDLGGISQPQGQLVAAQLYFDGVTHGGNLAQGHLGARGQAHIQQVVAQLALAADGAQYRILPNFDFCQCHFFQSSYKKFDYSNFYLPPV